MNTAEKRCKVVILETSDIPGNVFPINFRNNKETNSGFGKIANILKQEKQKVNYTLPIDNGDVIQGTSLTYYYAKFLQKNPMTSTLELNNKATFNL